MTEPKLLTILPGPAGTDPWTQSGCLDSKTGVPTLECIPVVFRQVIDWLLIFAGILAIFFIVYAGFRFVTSGGDPKQAGEAKKTLTFAIIGLVVILFSFFIINVMSGITNVECLKTFGFNC